MAPTWKKYMIGSLVPVVPVAAIWFAFTYMYLTPSNPSKFLTFLVSQASCLFVFAVVGYVSRKTKYPWLCFALTMLALCWFLASVGWLVG